MIRMWGMMSSSISRRADDFQGSSILTHRRGGRADALEADGVGTATAVAKIDDHADREPDDQPLPGLVRQAEHLRQTDYGAGDRHPRNERRAKGTLQLRRGAPKHHDTDADEREGEQSADAGERSEHADRQQARRERDDAA